MTDPLHQRSAAILHTPHAQPILNQISVSLIVIGLLSGLLVSYGVLAGDAQGRVNLLYVLLLFAFLPVLGLFVSVVLLVTGSASGLAGWLLALPVVPRQFRAAIVNLAVSGRRKSWLFYQTQCLTLSFGGGSVLVYLLLLMGSDISFVWRSTLLNAADLLPVLKLLALPWWFWLEAQPGLELLQQTQDFRLSAPAVEAPVLGQWWKYLLAAQCTYNLLPRTLLLVIARYHYRRLSKPPAAASTTTPPASPINHADDKRPELPLVETVEQPYVLIDWASAPAHCLAAVGGMLGAPARHSAAEPLAAGVALHREAVVVLVKSWEPPLGELADYLRQLAAPGPKYLLPLDWNEQRVVATRANHLQEWRRFCGTLPNWQLLQPDALR